MEIERFLRLLNGSAIRKFTRRVSAHVNPAKQIHDNDSLGGAKFTLRARLDRRMRFCFFLVA
jgi:hypothetical protein